jgi:3-phosphoshikimate 1-carboxyvinyltransferase
VLRSDDAVRLSPARRFRGRFSLPGDKSISHRLAILGALASGDTHAANFSSGADCASTLRCLEGLGVRIERTGHTVVIRGDGPERLRAPNRRLDAGNSGSTLRMLAGAVAARPFTTTLTGDASLRRRPVERVALPLRAMGADVETSNGCPPLTLHGRPLRGMSWDMDVASAQVKTAILLAGLQAEGVTTVREPSPSRDHTERLMPLFGAALERNGLQTSVRGGARLRSVQTTVPGDVSSAAFLIVAAVTLPDSAVELDGVLLNPQRTAFLEVLRQMGAEVETLVQAHEPEPVGRILARTSRLRGVEVPPALVPSLIDEVPALAIAAARAEGRFTLSAASELRVKESDRIAALAEGLRAMGARIEERDDGFEIEGGAPLRGARVRSFDDHRIAMAFAVAALGARGDSEIEDGECASVSFPEFWQLLEAGCG